MQRILTTYHLRQRLLRGLLIGLMVGVVFAFLLYGNYFNTWRTSFKDALYQGTRNAQTTGFISIVAIDDASLNALGRTPAQWSRQAHADLITILSQHRAKTLVFDVLFAEPTDEDAILVESLQEAGKGVPGERLPVTVVQPVGGVQNRTEATALGDRITFERFIYPTASILDASTDRFGRQYVGHVNVLPDTDGFVRRIPLTVADQNGEIMPTLGLVAYIAYLGFPPDEVVYESDRVGFSGRDLQTDDVGQMLIYYFDLPAKSGKDASHAFPTYSYIDVLCSFNSDADYFLSNFSCDSRVNPVQVPEDAFQSKMVLIGALDAITEPDRFPVPVSSVAEPMYGVEVHANVIENIHQSLGTVGRKLPLTEQPLSSQILVVLLMSVVSGLVLPLLRWYVAPVVVIVVYAIYFFVGVQLFQIEALVLELLMPAAALVTVLFLVFVANYLFEERRRNQLNDLFQRYVSPEIARKIVEIADQGQLDLSGEEREITVMFADIRGFTTLSEGLNPAEVVALLNTFLERMNAIVLAHGGAINKYIGDNLMAFWNAPYPQPDHAWLATQAGLEILKTIDELNASGNFSAPVQFGIGINTGEAVVGNIGSSQRMEYTPIGDTVNVASRLSGVAKGGSLLVGAQTFSAIQGRIEPMNSEQMLLKGKQQAIQVYEFRVDGE